MDNSLEQYYPYSWHQSHDQATVLLMVPYETTEDDVEVVITKQYIVAGLRGSVPTVKGRLYGTVDCSTSAWQLEPRVQTSRLAARERTTSTASTASTRSSFAMVSDPEISSSFAASLENQGVLLSETEFESSLAPSPAHSSPSLASVGDETSSQLHWHGQRARRRLHSSSGGASPRPVSPAYAIESLTSSYSSSSYDSSPSQSGRLLTLHLEKDQSVIWPSLINGPVPEDMSPNLNNSIVFNASDELEHQYNMDPTTLTLIGIEMFDIRKNKEDAFEYLIRAWHLHRVPSATIRLVSHYFPLHLNIDSVDTSEESPARGTIPYYLQCAGGRTSVAKLFFQAGLLYLDGRGPHLLNSPSASLSSLRLPDYSTSTLLPSRSQSGVGAISGGFSGTGTAAWKRDRKVARQLFERARHLHPALDIPSLPPDAREDYDSSEAFEMPSIIMQSAPSSTLQDVQSSSSAYSRMKKRRSKPKSASLAHGAGEPELFKISTPARSTTTVDEEGLDTWLLYVPGLVGAGTAMLVVGVIGALSFSSWGRRGQS